MANLVIENTGVEHLYPDGIPIAEVEIVIKNVIDVVARKSSLAVLADPYFSRHTPAQKFFSELHGEGDRITMDFLKDGAEDILPVFNPLQIYMTDAAPGPVYEFNTPENLGKIIYRYQMMDTRETDYKLDYTSATLFDIRIDETNIKNVKKYLEDALIDYVLMELYEAIGYDKKHNEYKKAYTLKRQYVAYWAKQDTSLSI